MEWQTVDRRETIRSDAHPFGSHKVQRVASRLPGRFMVLRTRDLPDDGRSEFTVSAPNGAVIQCVVGAMDPLPAHMRRGVDVTVDGATWRVTKGWFRRLAVCVGPDTRWTVRWRFGGWTCADDRGRVIATRRWSTLRLRADLPTPDAALVVAISETGLADSVTLWFWFRGF